MFGVGLARHAAPVDRMWIGLPRLAVFARLEWIVGVVAVGRHPADDQLQIAFAVRSSVRSIVCPVQFAKLRTRQWL